MERLTNPSSRVLSERESPRDRRDRLLREANRHRYRLHRMPQLQEELRQATADLLKQELAARQRSVAVSKPTAPEPLGDAGAVGASGNRSRLPYKD